jgi:hypothetical protein
MNPYITPNVLPYMATLDSSRNYTMTLTASSPGQFNNTTIGLHSVSFYSADL